MSIPSLLFRDHTPIPQLGYGVWRIHNDEVCHHVTHAINIGYRHIDTAAFYANEPGIGKAVDKAIKESGLQRSDIFLTSKLWNNSQGYESTITACMESLKQLNTDYLDLYLIHWPVPQQNLYLESWKALIHLKKEGVLRAIGVSNFRIHDLERLMNETSEAPSLNQIELHPEFQQRELCEFHQHYNIVTEAWGPLGQGKILNNPILANIAKEHGKTIAQIILRWHIENNNSAIPKSSSQTRMAENMAIFDFSLTKTNHQAIAALDKADGRIGPDPANFV